MFALTRADIIDLSAPRFERAEQHVALAGLRLRFCDRWRHHLAIAPAAAGVVAGFGPASYDLGLRAAADLLGRRI